MKIASAWAPGNISLLFKVMPDPNPSKMGSLGSGFTVSQGATVTIGPGRGITYNGDPVELPTVSEVMKRLTKQTCSIAITSPLPLGCGFGISGASALASAYAINEFFQLKKTPLELVTIAHTAEVIHKTGLGDVGNQQYGGCCVKFVTSSLFQIQHLPFTGLAVYVKSWGKIPTPVILSNPVILNNLDNAADYALARIKDRMADPSFSFAELLRISSRFTRQSGLIAYAPNAHKTMNFIEKRGGHAAMIILGDALVSDTPFPQARKLLISNQGVGAV